MIRHIPQSPSLAPANPARRCHRFGTSAFAFTMLVLFPILSAQATIYRVGAGADCTHPNLAAALTAAVADASPGPHEIRLVAGGHNVINQSIDNPAQDLRLRGGFPNCAATSPGIGMRSGLNAGTVSGRRVLRLFNNVANPRRTIRLERLSLTGGNNPAADASLGGGAILAIGRLDVHLIDDTRIEGNIAQSGGGISLLSLTSNVDQFTRLYLRGGSSICNNQATGGGLGGNGGGINNIGGAWVTIWNGTICDNQARRHGGGVHLASNLSFLRFDIAADWERAEFRNNLAGTAGYATNTGFGGAVFSAQGPIQYTSSLTPAGVRSLIFAENTANFGGAIHVQGGSDAGDSFTSVELRNVELHQNLARARGGAIYLSDAVDMRMYVWGAGPCDGTFPSIQACVDVWRNTAENAGASSSIGGGGAAFLAHDPSSGASRPALRVAGARFDANEDPNGTAAAIDARGNASVRILRSLFLNNLAGGNPSFRALIESRNNVLLGYSTVLSNAVSHLFWLDNSEIEVTGSILYAPGVQLLAGITPSIETGNCLLAHTTTGIPATGVQVGNPMLEAHNGYAPKPRSRAVDACAAGVGDNFFSAAHDAYRLPVPHTIASVPNLAGSFDLGAVEQRDVLFYGGFGTRPNN